LQRRRQADGMAERGIVHAQVVADGAHHDLAGVEAHAHREAQPAFDAQRVAVAAQLLAQVERRVAGALGGILERERRAEQRNDAVAVVLVHRTLEAVHAVGEHGEEAVHQAVPLFRIELLGELHRALYVGEQHSHLFALADQCMARAEDLLGDVARGIRQRCAAAPVSRCAGQRATAGAAVAVVRLAGGAARRADLAPRTLWRIERAATRGAEPPLRAVGVSASGALHQEGKFTTKTPRTPRGTYQVRYI